MNFGKNTITLTVSKVLSLVMSIGITVILSRYRTLEEYGTYAQLILIVNLSVSILSFGINNSINYFLGKFEHKNDRDIFISTYFILNTLFGVIIGIFLIVFSPKFGIYFNNSSIKDYGLILFVLPWTILTNSCLSYFLVFSNRSKYVLAVETTYNFLVLLTALISSIIEIDFKTYLYFFTFINSVQSIFVYLLVFKIYKLENIIIKINIAKEILKFSIPLGISTILGTLNLQIDQIMISSFYKLSEFAIYANAARELPIAVLSSSVVLVVFPIVSKLVNRKYTKEAVFVWKESIIFSSIIMFFLISVLFVFAPEIINILYSEKFLTGVSVFRVYSLVLIFRITYFGMILNTLNKTSYVLRTSFLALILNIILNFVFYKLFGFIGPAIATFFVTGIVATMQIWYTSKLVNISFSEIFPWLEILKLGIINIFLACFISISKYILSKIFLNNDFFLSIILGIFWLTIYYLLINKKTKEKWDYLNSSSHCDII